MTTNNNGITPLDKLALQNKYNELEKKADESNIDEQLAISQEKFIHPALDFAGRIAVIGFRVRNKDDKGKVTDSNRFIVIKNGEVSVQTDKTVYDENETYYIDDTDKLLPLLIDKWTVEGIKAFAKETKALERNHLFDNLVSVAKRYFYLANETEYDLMIAWIMGTYFHRLFFSFPFLHLKAPKGSGKSQILGFLEKLCFNAIKARPTLASMGDIITSLRGTFLIDQADSLHNENNYEMLEILADSYKRDGGKRRVLDMKRGRKQLEFETFSPKAFASLIDLPEDLKDRCVLVPLVRSSHIFPTPDGQNEDWHSQRGNLYKLLLHFQEVRALSKTVQSTYVNNNQLYGRTLDLWLPIETIMSFCHLDKERVHKSRDLYLQRNALMKYEPKEYEEKVVALLIGKFGDQEVIEVSVKEITEGLNFQRELEEEELNEKKVGWVITNFNLSSKKKRYNKGIVYIFEKAKLQVVYKQYFNSYEETTQLHDSVT